jgi:hypothetical protein
MNAAVGRYARLDGNWHGGFDIVGCDANPAAVEHFVQLRIIDEDLWERVKERQRGLRKLPSFHEKQRPRMLLSYLLKCGCCGGGFSKVSQNQCARPHGTF